MLASPGIWLIFTSAVIFYLVKWSDHLKGIVSPVSAGGPSNPRFWILVVIYPSGKHLKDGWNRVTELCVRSTELWKNLKILLFAKRLQPKTASQSAFFRFFQISVNVTHSSVTRFQPSFGCLPLG